MYDGRGSSRGQVLIIFVFAIIGLIAIAGLAIDGGNIYVDRRHAQNAADTAALTAALARDNWERNNLGTKCINFNTATSTPPPGTCDAVTKALNIAGSNGYTANGGNIRVDVYSPPIDGYYATCTGKCDPNDYIEVVISDDVDTWFARVIGMTQTHNRVEAVAVAITATRESPVPGQAIVALDPTGCSFDSGSSNAATWTISGGGVFSNDKACAKNSGSVTFTTPGQCATAVDTASTFGCTPTIDPGAYLNYPTDILDMLPPTPACDGTAYYDKKDKLIHPQAGKDGSKIDALDGSLGYQYAPGLYCITGSDANIHDKVTGSDVTFYVMSSTYSTKYNGGGSLAISAPGTGDYAGVLMFSTVLVASPTTGDCTQDVEIRGNGSTPITGTVFMPGACIDWRGNGTAAATDSQLIGFQVTSNGNANVAFDYAADDNYKKSYPGQVGIMH